MNFQLNCEESDEITVFAAHTEPMPYFNDDKKIHYPRAADDTAGVAMLLMMTKFREEITAQ